MSSLKQALGFNECSPLKLDQRGHPAQTLKSTDIITETSKLTEGRKIISLVEVKR